MTEFPAALPPLHPLALAWAAGLLMLAVAVALQGRRLPAEAARRLRRQALWVAGAALVAGRVVHVAGLPGAYLERPWLVLALWDGGVSAQAALVAGLAVLVLAPAGGGTARRGLAVAVAVGVLAGWATWLVHPQAGPRAAAPAAIATIDGREIALADRQGRPLVLNLWATWCAPCRRELPMMAEVAAARADLDVVFVNQREPEARVGLFLATEGFRLGLVALDPDGLLGRRHAAFGLPTTVFIDGDGQVRAVHVGEMTRAQFEAGLDDLAAAGD